MITGLPRIDLAHQGLVYLLDSAANDPVTLLVITAAIVSPMIGPADRAVSCGIVLYLAYVIWAGGDFMSGRLLAAPFFCSLMPLARQPLPRFSVEWALAFGLVWLTGLSAPRPVVFSTASYGADLVPADAIPPSQIADERRVYYPTTALLTARRGASIPSHRWLKLGEEERKRGRHVVVTYTAGFIGYAAGPEVHLLDRWALGDALLARLPSEASWRIGHFERHIPIGYEDTVATGQNLIRDPGVATYYEKLRIVTEGPIWSRERFRTIWRMNAGAYRSSRRVVRAWNECKGVEGHCADVTHSRSQLTECSLIRCTTRAKRREDFVRALTGTFLKLPPTTRRVPMIASPNEKISPFWRSAIRPMLLTRPPASVGTLVSNINTK